MSPDLEECRWEDNEIRNQNSPESLLGGNAERNEINGGDEFIIIAWERTMQ